MKNGVFMAEQFDWCSSLVEHLLQLVNGGVSVCSVKLLPHAEPGQPAINTREVAVSQMMSDVYS